MKLIGAIATVTGLALTAAAFMPKPAPKARQTVQAAIPQVAASAPQIDASPFQQMRQAAGLPNIAPTVPEFQSFGQIHVNGQAAQEVGWGGASPPLIIGGISCCRSRMWRTQAPMGQAIEVHRDLLQNGVEFTNPAYPPFIVSWWAVLLDAQWRPAQLNGTDYNVAGGGFTVSP